MPSKVTETTPLLRTVSALTRSLRLWAAGASRLEGTAKAAAASRVALGCRKKVVKPMAGTAGATKASHETGVALP